MSNRAWVTLATNDSYGLGALVLAHSLRRASSVYPAVVLITPSVTEAMKDRLRAVFAEVVIVDVLDSRDAAHLALLQRPELGITFTKIHCWNLTQYEKCVFLDADTLVVQNCDELFERDELSAAPDVGWPDCFNSGVFVYSPSADTFSKLVTFASERGSFDGGDQGLLNSYFSDWAHGDINKHLPFLYNVTSAAFYSYIPALKHFGQNLKIIHFIGATKPWLQQYNWESRSVEAPEHLRGFLQIWWDLFVAQVHAQLDTSMTGVAGNLARIVPGAPLQREAVDELARRQGWEAGNIDYMGADSFDNIWAKISQTLSQPPSSVEQSPPQEEQSAPTEQQPIRTETKLEPPSEPIEPAVTETEKELQSEAVVEKVVVDEPSLTPDSVEASAAAAAEAVLSQIEPELSPPANETIELESVPVPAEVAADVSSTESVPVEEKSEVIQEIPVTAVEALKIEESPKGVELAGATAPESVAVPPTSVLKPDTAEQESAPEVPESPKVESEAAPIVPETAPIVPEAAPIVPEIAPIVPEVAPIVPEAAPIVPEAAPIVPEAAPIVPEAAPVVPEAAPIVPEVAPVIPEAAPVPQVTETKPETTSDSPPLANTPSKEEIPKAPAAKSTEEAAQETRL